MSEYVAMGFRYTLKSHSSQTQSTPLMSNTTTNAIREPSLIRNNTIAPGCEFWGVVLERPKSLPLSSTKIKYPPKTERPQTVWTNVRTDRNDEQTLKVPILGPTRQQTQMYLKKKRRHNVVPVGGPEEKLPVTEKINPVGLTLFDTKAANTVLFDAEMQIKSGYPTIAASSMVSRRRRSEVYDELEFSPDVRFFSELVKPIQYRWKFQRDKDKIILPSKQGYHPRSKSPTFQRLVEATEKLQIIIEHDSGMGSFEKDEESETQSQFTPDGPVLSMDSLDREVQSEPASVKPSICNIPPVKPIELHSHPRPIPKFKLEPDPVTIIENPKPKEETKVIENVSDNEDEDFVETPTQVKATIVQQPEFKVDFKKMDTHSELHLFLPLIGSGPVSNEIHEKPSKSVRRTSKVTLPSIDDSNQCKSEEKLTAKKERKTSENRRKRKKLAPRIKSGNEDIEVRDILNDVTTLMSMKKEQMLDYHSASMCMFENCIYHPHHNKSTKIRQA